MSDIKKKFMDILFESSNDEEEIAETIEEKETVKQAETPSIKAKDILYRKNNSSPFINYGDSDISVKDIVDTSTVEQEADYVMSSQISPMFGMINNGNVVKPSKEENGETMVKKPDNSYLDIVTSPIYGYGKNDSIHSSAHNQEYELNEEEELNKVFFDKEDKFSDTQEISLFDDIEDDKQGF